MKKVVLKKYQSKYRDMPSSFGIYASLIKLPVSSKKPLSIKSHSPLLSEHDLLGPSEKVRGFSTGVWSIWISRKQKAYLDHMGHLHFQWTEKNRKCFNQEVVDRWKALHSDFYGRYWAFSKGVLVLNIKRPQNNKHLWHSQPIKIPSQGTYWKIFQMNSPLHLECCRLRLWWKKWKKVLSKKIWIWISRFMMGNRTHF